MTKVTSTLAFALLLAVHGLASAQDAVPPPVAPAPEPAPEPAPAPAPMPEPALTAEPAAPVAVEAAPAEAPAEDPAAEPEAPAPTISGFVEAAYHLNLSDTQAAPVLRSYDSEAGNTFLLHTAHLAVAHSFTDEVSAVIEIDAGSDAAITEATGTAYAFDLQEAYAKYAKGGFSLTAGKFVTYAGTEVIEGPLNPTLTRGYLFGLAEAFTHVGFKAHYTSEGGVDVGIGLTNGWDNWVDENDWKTIIARIGYSGESMFIGLSGSFGSEQYEENDDDNPRLSLDLTGGIIAGPMTINFQGNVGMETLEDMGVETDASWWGIGVQPVYNGDVFTFGARVEYFSDPDGARTGFADGSFLNFTLTPGFIIAEHFVLRLELRADLALDASPSKDVLNGESTQFTFGTGVSYTF